MVKHRGGLECEGLCAVACWTNKADYCTCQHLDERGCEVFAGARSDLYLPRDSRPMCFLMSPKMEAVCSKDRTQ